MSGYSGTALSKKLGIKTGNDVILLNTPDDFTLVELPEDVTIRSNLRSKHEAQVIVLFSPNAIDMTSKFTKCVDRLSTAGGLWIAWPKKASGVKTDLHDMLVRTYGLDQGLVDNKVCAIDETWSALRFVRRKNER